VNSASYGQCPNAALQLHLLLLDLEDAVDHARGKRFAGRHVAPIVA